MTMKKFITMDLQTGKKVLQTIEASFIKFSDEHFPGVTNLDAALKAEIARALAAEKLLTTNLEKEIKRAEGVEATIKALIGELGEQDSSVKEAIDRIDGLITTLTSKVDQHIANKDIHITAQERSKWDEAVETLKSKADTDTVTRELGKKVATDHLMTSDGKIKAEHLPSIAINSVQTVVDEAAAMKLVIENGDVVIINPDAQVTRNKSKVVKGTFICVDDKADTFEKKFRQLYSNSDSISKAEVDNLIKVEKERAEKVEEGLRSDILIINGEDNVAGSIKHFVKLEKERAEEVENDLDQRLTSIEPTVQKLAGGKDEEGSAANFADKALIVAKAYTNEKIEEVNTAADELAGRVEDLEEVVGSEQQGLVKDVAGLKSDVSIIKGDASQEGSINKALADAKKYADSKVAEEQTARTAADTELSKRVKSLEDSENLSINLICDGVRQHDLLAIRAGNTVVKATLTDSSVVGIVARTEGPNSKTVVSGRVTGFSDLKPGTSYFLGENGTITDKIPTEVGQYIIKVGVALTTTDLLVNIQEAIKIGD